MCDSCRRTVRHSVPRGCVQLAFLNSIMGGAVNKLIKDIKEDILNQESEIEAVQFEVDETISGQGAAARATFTRLGLSNGTVNQLYGAYRAIDMDGGGSVSDMEFYTFFRLDQTKFTDRAFFLFDKDGTGEIDFEEFVLAVWNFCTVEADDFVRFTFNLYDLDGGGTLDTEEIKELVAAVLGQVDQEGKKAQELLGYLKLDKNGEANIKSFRELVKMKPEVLEPAYVLQRRLRARIVGEAFWRSLARKRKAMIRAELDKATQKIEVMANGVKDIEDEDGDVFIRSGADVDAARKAAIAKADAEVFKGTEMERAKARIKKVTLIRKRRDATQSEWQSSAAEEENSGIGMVMAMEDPGATGRAEAKVMGNISREYYEALTVGQNDEWRDFCVKRTIGGKDRMGRRRRRLSTAVRVKGPKPKYMTLLQ